MMWQYIQRQPNSKQYFVAGYWGILFRMGWRPSFCPRLKTLQDYTNLGPFKNESDMYPIKRKGQENEKINTSTTNSADMPASVMRTTNGPKQKDTFDIRRQSLRYPKESNKIIINAR